MSAKELSENLALENIEKLSDELKTSDKKDLIYLFNKNTNCYDVIDPATGLMISEERSMDKIFKDYVYTPQAGMIICEAIRSGMTLAQMANNPKFPSTAAIYYWKSKYKDFSIRFENAFRERGDYFHDKAIEIALDTSTKDEATINKLKVDTLKWAAERADPEKYGTKKAEISVHQPSVIVLNTGIDREGAPTIEELLSKKEPITIEAEVISSKDEE